MVYRGTVKGNVVTLAPGASLPDGASVLVEVEKASGHELPAQQNDPFEMGRLAVQTGIADLATNIDHYLYGHPKVSHAG